MDITSLRQSIATIRAQPLAWTTRFAPSPTGHLHLGHVISAMLVWGIGRAVGAKIILRMEDHDENRSRRLYEQSILDDLTWLGFHADAGVTDAQKPSPYRQSDHRERFAAYLNQLAQTQHVYACQCSRKQISAAATVASEELHYPGTCRDLNLPWAIDCGLRVHLPPRSFTFRDVFLGTQTQTPAQQCGDLLIRDRDGFWTYNFAVVVDDIDQDVNLIIRGQDLTASTGRQLFLRELLKVSKPIVFGHHPLVVNQDQQKLSKRDFAVGVAQQRADGVRPEFVLGQAAAAIGLIPSARDFSLTEWFGMLS